MSFTFPTQYVFYVDFTQQGTIQASTFSKSTKNFNYSELINRADNYIIAVERFNIPTNTVPMQVAQPAFLTLQDNGGGNPTTFDLNETFSLLEFFQQLNGAFPNMIFSLTSDLRMAVSYDWTTQELVLSENAQCIFDMPAIIGSPPAVTGQATIRGGSPIPDNFDRLIDVEIVSGETLTQQQQEVQSSEVLRFLVTDFLNVNPYSTSFGFEEGKAPDGAYTLSYPVRQSLQYFGENKRPIMMKGKSPISNISLEALAVVRNPDSTVSRERIRISPCGYFNVKLGFYLKNF